jgi:penicillin-binding protein 1A
MVQATKPRWSRRPFTAPKGIHWVRVDRISGKRVLDGMPGSDPKSSIIWEAFKAESEAKRGIASAELAAQRAELLNALKRGARVREGLEPISSPGADGPAQAGSKISVDTTVAGE